MQVLHTQWKTKQNNLTIFVDADLMGVFSPDACCRLLDTSYCQRNKKIWYMKSVQQYLILCWIGTGLLRFCIHISPAIIVV